MFSRQFFGVGRVEHPEARVESPSIRVPAVGASAGWDIIKPRGPAKRTYFCPYIIMDIASRYIVAWVVVLGESAELAKHLTRYCCGQQFIAEDCSRSSG